ncbi:MAG: Integrase protein family [Cenarchaeum symbiont of Oopsacas minuta]|nr:Integrase protein family [Cenarchaeum symbiont of Oopsacas minuta]
MDTDEVWLKISGQKKYLFASIDDNTRYWLAYDVADTKFQHNADRLLELTKNAIGKNPKHFTTDGLPAYRKSSKRVFGKDAHHHSHIHLNGDHNNNKMERFNGTFRDREINFRGLKKTDTALIGGFKTYYNYTKKHMGLNGVTPAEASNIKVDGLNYLVA